MILPRNKKFLFKKYTIFLSFIKQGIFEFFYKNKTFHNFSVYKRFTTSILNGMSLILSSYEIKKYIYIKERKV